MQSNTCLGDDAFGLTTECPNKWRLSKWGTGPKHGTWHHLHQITNLDDGTFRCVALTSKNIGDVTMLKPMFEKLKAQGTAIKRFYADGAYGNSDEVWKFLTADNSVDFVTSFKRNTGPTNNGRPAREMARLWCSNTYRDYVGITGYSNRWKSEGGFSDFKEIFPEKVRARTVRGMGPSYRCVQRCTTSTKRAARRSSGPRATGW